MQTRLEKPQMKYSYGAYNKIVGDRQRIRITEGCPHNCPFCYELTEVKIFDIPELKKNIVEISDMNLLYKKQALKIIEDLGRKKVNGKIIYYELICGVDYRFLNQKIANALKKSRFRKIRLAWDWLMKDQYKIKDAIDMLKKGGYIANRIMVFIICNWDIPYKECCKKLDLLKIWGVQVSDCYYDNQTFPNVIPIGWTDDQNKGFRKKCRKHNQLVNFRIDPEVKP